MIEADRSLRPAAALRRWAPVLAVALGGLALSLLAYVIARHADEARLRSEFELRAEWRAHDIERRLDTAAQSVEALAVFAAVEPQMNAGQFNAFAELQHGAGDLENAEFWAPWVRDSERAAVTQAARRDGEAGFEIREFAPDGGYRPAAGRADYLPVMFADAYDGQLGVLGFDLFSLPGRRVAALRARDEGHPVATPPIGVYSPDGARLGFLVFWPVYSGGVRPALPEERRRLLRGMAVGRFRFEQIMPAVIAHTPKPAESIDFFVYGDGAGAPAQRVARYDPVAGRFTFPIASYAGRKTPSRPDEQAGGLVFSRELHVLDRRWLMVARFAPAIVAAERSRLPAGILGIGLLATFFLAFMAGRERGRRIEIEAAVAARTAELRRQVEERQRAEERFRDFAETASDWLWETDAEHRYIYVSENVTVGAGYPVSRYLGKRRTDPGTLDLAPGELEAVIAETEGRRPFRDHISKRRRSDGSTWYARTSGKPVFDRDGGFLGFRGASSNVTAEVTARQEADAARARLIEALEIMPAGVMIFDRDERLVLANARIREMFPRATALFDPGTTRQAQLEYVVARGAIAEARADPDGWVRQRMAAFRSAPANMLLPLADGRWIQHFGRRSSEGTISVLIDVTELKRAEEEARAAKRRSDESFALLDSLQSAAPIGFALVDPKFRFLRVNRALAEATGLAAERHVGQTVEAVVPSLWPQIAPQLARVLESGQPIVNVELAGDMPARPGQERHWLATFYPVRVEDRVTGIGFIAVEVSAQRRVEAQLRQAQKMEAIGILTGGVAHDFNNLLGVIIGNLDLLAETGHADAEVLELAGEARDAALRGADLTRRLLAFARRQPLQPQQLDANQLVGGATKLLGRLLGESVEISLELQNDIWPILVDAAQLEASLANLATNARDAMPAGGSLRIATRNCQLDAGYAAHHPYVTPGDYVLIEVTDTGSGMTPEVMSRIFEPFFTTKEQGRGSGLGLSMVFGFMKQSGGHINVYSELGHGTTFRLYFPRAEQGAPSKEEGAAEPLPLGRGECVLLVEDNAALRRMAVRQLGELGYKVREAENAQQAIEALVVDPAIDLLFTDVIMPGGMDGRQLADLVAARWPRVKVLLTSGFPGSVVGSGGPVQGAHLLSKPYRRDQLARALRQAIGRKDEAIGEDAGGKPA